MTLPFRFLTIVLNGEPFIRHHLEVFRRLTTRWHWDIVEGVAALAHDTAWSVAAGGKIPDELHRDGLSSDGTSAYLDGIAHELPGRITIHRKPGFWDGKREMVNAPLAALDASGDECLLVQIDADELWTVDQLERLRELFLAEPTRTAAWFWCWYFVGERLVVTSKRKGGWTANPRLEWLRAWRYQPGMRFTSHEPPVLSGSRDGAAYDVGLANPFFHEETEARGLRFQHFAYVTADSLRWKQTYYGYRDALTRWQALQAHDHFPAPLRQFFPWVGDESEVDRVEAVRIDPLAVHDADGWRFTASAPLPDRFSRRRARPPVVVVDGVYFQRLTGGIGRVWYEVLHEWAQEEYGAQIVVVDRAYTMPPTPGIRRRVLAPLDYAAVAEDRARLQRICDEEEAAVFISSYHTSPLTTPAVLLVHDMIPELFRWDHPMWRDKRHAIDHARALVAVSARTAFDLARLAPERVRLDDITIAHPGVSPRFAPAPDEIVARFRAKYRIERPYFLVFGEKGASYKNTVQLYRALAKLPGREALALVVVGVEDVLPEQRALCPGMTIHCGRFNDSELVAAYTGALALVFPSLYEGFGLPVLEAMACGCPVIALPVASIPEVLGDAGLYVNPTDVDTMVQALVEVQRPEIRERCRARGRLRARGFTWARTAARLREVLTRVAERKS